MLILYAIPNHKNHIELKKVGLLHGKKLILEKIVAHLYLNDFGKCMNMLVYCNGSITTKNDMWSTVLVQLSCVVKAQGKKHRG